MSRNIVGTSKVKFRQVSKKRVKKPIVCSPQQKISARIYDENGVDVTPKPLFHESYPGIDEKHQIVLDAFGLRQDNDMLQSLIMPSSDLKSISSLTTFPPSLAAFDEGMNSLLSVNAVDSTVGGDDLERAPSPFYLSNFLDTCTDYPDRVTIILRETETIFLFDMPQLTADLDTPEGQAVKEENERYDYITIGAGSNRKLANAETQTIRAPTKSRATHQEKQKRMNRGTFVNNWVMYDTYNTPELLEEEHGKSVERSITPDNHLNQSQDRRKLPIKSNQLDTMNSDDWMMQLSQKPSFQEAIVTMERIIASNFYITAQKRFKGLIKPDPYDLNLKFTYKLDLLWIHSHPLVVGRTVSCIRWNYTNNNLLAAGYSANAKETNGILLIWCMKNPGQPDRIYKFDSPVSSIDWSRIKPNQLAIGFYDGTLRVIDVSSRALMTLKKTERRNSPSFSPYWQIQWWYNEENSNLPEKIFTSNQDGAIFYYETDKNFSAKEMMRISRIEGKISGVKRMNCRNLYDIPISKNPGALLLRRHPITANIYLVASDEGCVHQCSTNYLHHHVDSYLAHDGPVYSLEYSPFCSKILLTCGADWCTRIWADGITEPLITMSTRMACVRAAAWSPTNSTIIATCVNNEICIWDIKRRTYRPISITDSPSIECLVLLEFTKCGDQLVTADASGNIYIYSLEEMPFPPFDQTGVLVRAIKKSITTKPELLKKLRKIGEPFQ